MTARREQLAASVQSKDYRDAFVAEHIRRGLPLKIRSMRQRRGWSQQELAARVGMTQEGISRLENPNYGTLTLMTLLRIAAAFDVGLAVDFVPFSTLVDRAANRSRDDMDALDFDHDTALRGQA